MNIELNGRCYEAESGQTILEAAKAHGVYIPTLCYHAKTGGLGKCRVCVVEVEGMRGIVTACTMQVAEGMKIVTESPSLRNIRKIVVDLLLSSGHHDCLSCAQCGNCELQDVAYSLGITQRR